MHFHPIDTKDAYVGAEKSRIAHLAYHLHYNQYNVVQDKRTGKSKFEAAGITQKYTPIAQLKTTIQQAELQRQKAFVELTNIFEIRQLSATAGTAILHGMGAAHVRESALTIHPVYGVPYIPASSVKGLVRAWFIEAYCNGDEKELKQQEVGSALFGSQGIKGIAQFYDIFLHDELQLVPDVLTPHFKDYYAANGKAATDDQSPNIIKFWSVVIQKATIFVSVQQHIPGDLQSSLQNVNVKQLADALVEWTIQAFTEMGIGAKTSLGYGMFSQIKDVTAVELTPIAERIQADKEAYERNQQRLKAEQEMAQRKEQEAQRLAEMSPNERVIYELQTLDAKSEVDVARSKELYKEVIELAEKSVAQALKEFWTAAGEWHVKKSQKKQLEKVKKVEELLT